MKYDLIIKNGCMVSSTSTIRADIAILDGKIAAIAQAFPQGAATECIDAKGLYIIPGLVDPHVHMMDPGFTEREDFMTGSAAAAMGGVTTIIEHHRTEPPTYNAQLFREKQSYLSNRSHVDFCLMGGGTPDNIADLAEMWQCGAVAFKMFTCGLHGQVAMYSGHLLECLQEIKRIGARVLIHCEDDGITQKSEELLKKQGRCDYLSQHEWRSVLAERVAVHTVIEIAKATGAQVTIAHVSSPDLLADIRAAREAGYPLTAESCPHYFYLTVDDLAQKGPWVKFAPATRDSKTASQMWQALNNDYIAYLGSDHCPFPKSQKQVGEDDIWRAPNGIPGVETGLMLMLNGVNERKTTLNKVVQVMSEQPAKLYGLFPRKGIIAVGADADLVLVDLEREETIENEKIVSKCGWSPYDQKLVKGLPTTVLLRGNIIVRERELLGKPGIGRFVARPEQNVNKNRG